VFASKQMLAAKNGRNPKPTSIAAAMATGVPKPAAPSMNAENANAIKSACTGWLVVKPESDVFMISNFPVSTVNRYSRIAVKTIQPIGSSPFAAP
jgi:hypothetical protein